MTASKQLSRRLVLQGAFGASVGLPLLEELRANPAGFYVSLRTTREPQGALRGTIQ